MMSIYAVMVRHTGQTWIDSLWVNKFAFKNGAEARVNDLKRIHEALKLDTGVWVVEMTLQDGELAASANPDTAAPSVQPTTEESPKAEAVLCGESGK